MRAAGFDAARKEAELAALEELAAHDRDLLQELLERFAAEYAAAKRRESAVDFEDLQLATTSQYARQPSCGFAWSWSTSSRTRTACSAS